jgi:hypothetical protein
VIGKNLGKKALMFRGKRQEADAARLASAPSCVIRRRNNSWPSTFAGGLERSDRN